MASDDRYHGKLVCPSCEGVEFCPEDEPFSDDPETVMKHSSTELEDILLYGAASPEANAITVGINAVCLGCGESLSFYDFPWNKRRGLFKVGEVLDAEVVQKKYNKLSVRVDENDETAPLTIVTNDMKVKVGELVVAAVAGLLPGYCQTAVMLLSG